MKKKIALGASVDCIPNSLWDVVLDENGKVNLVASVILSRLVYLANYSQSPTLRITKHQLRKRFGLTESQLRRGIEFLQSLEVVSRKQDNNGWLFELNIPRLEQLAKTRSPKNFPKKVTKAKAAGSQYANPNADTISSGLKHTVKFHKTVAQISAGDAGTDNDSGKPPKQSTHQTELTLFELGWQSREVVCNYMLGKLRTSHIAVSPLWHKFFIDIQSRDKRTGHYVNQDGTEIILSQKDPAMILAAIEIAIKKHNEFVTISKLEVVFTHHRPDIARYCTEHVEDYANWRKEWLRVESKQ